MTSGFHFVANLKPYTLHRGAGNRRFGSYLLSIDYARALADLAREVIADGVVLCAELSGWLPLLGTASDPGLRLTGAMARVGHNHWVLQRIETEARQHARSHTQIVDWAEKVVRQYGGSSADPQWKRAVETAWRIVRRAADATQNATPTPLTVR
jgi:hypothetical protein